jgi:hypothetical protein
VKELGAVLFFLDGFAVRGYLDASPPFSSAAALDLAGDEAVTWFVGPLPCRPYLKFHQSTA